MPDESPVLIAGGGIGGLCLALCLAEHGCPALVLEQSRAFGEPGAGIQLSPNCARVLHWLGLAEALQAKAFLPQAIQFRHWRSGRVLAQQTLGEAARRKYGFPYYHIHRGDLLGLLTGAAAARPGIELSAGARLEGLAQDAQGVTAHSSEGQRRGRALVGADGIHSLVRDCLFGRQAPRFTGQVAWRMLAPSERLPAGRIPPAAVCWWGPGRHLVHYFVRGGALVNLVCVVEKAGWEVESWTERGEWQELKGDFAGWHGDVQLLIDCADRGSLRKWALFDRPSMPRWGRGRATLLGDACHPMLPFMAQGAAMAIEDAAVLSRCLAGASDIAGALRRYEALRQPRAARVQRHSRRNAKLFHLSGFKAWLRDLAAGPMAARTMDRLFRYDALR